MQDPKEREIYNARLMAQWNYKSSMEGAKEAGKEEEKIEVIKRLYSKKISIEEIAERVSLSKQEVENIISNI